MAEVFFRQNGRDLHVHYISFKIKNEYRGKRIFVLRLSWHMHLLPGVDVPQVTCCFVP